MSNPRQLALLRAASELWDAEEREVGYLSRVFTQTSLPYRDPGDRLAWTRRNGDMVLAVQPGVTEKDGKPVSIGYPYGTVPRLLLTWLSTEAVRTKSPELMLGTSLAEFMRALDLTPSGGKRGTITRLRKQMERLFASTLTVRWEGASGNRTAGGRINIASAYDLWWADADPERPSLLPSTVMLSEKFFEEVTAHPVPLDVGALRVLRGSALRLDIYAWLTYRMSYLRNPTTVPWESLKAQFGSELADTRQGRGQFRRDFERNLREVMVVYPQAKVEVTPSGVHLKPSKPHVPMTRRSVRTLPTS